MKRGRSTGKPTKAQEYRFAAIKECGCIACRMRMHQTYPEIHHLTVGGKHGQKRRGHDYTVGLCPYHHRGDMTGMGNIDLLGPSYAQQPRLFRETFGNDDELLAYQNKLIEEMG